MAGNDKKERKIYDFPGNNRSDVWKFFGFYKNEQQKVDKSKAVCKLCRKEYSYSGKMNFCIRQNLQIES